jgi:hypothetical protein
MSQLESVAELAERILDTADAGALALTAAWRAWPRPDDPAARAAHAIAVLRELRGGLHFCALRTEGLDIPVAVLADPGGGPERLSRTAWSPEAIDDLRRRASAMPDLVSRWQRAEAATDTALAQCVKVITAAERAHLAHQLQVADSVPPHRNRPRQRRWNDRTTPGRIRDADATVTYRGDARRIERPKDLALRRRTS